MKSRKARKRGAGRLIDQERSRRGRLASLGRSRVALSRLMREKAAEGLTAAEERRLAEMRRNLYGE